MTVNRAEPLAQTPPSLQRNFMWTLLGNIVYAAAQWGMLVLLAKLGGPEMVGLFTLGLSVGAPIILFFNLQLRAVQATDACDEFAFAHYFGLRLLGVALALLTIALCALVASDDWWVRLLVVLVGLFKSVESLTDVVYGSFQHRERLDLVSTSMLIKGPGGLIGLAAGLYLTGSLLWGVTGLLLAWLLAFFLYDLPTAARLLSNAPEGRAVRLPYGFALLRAARPSFSPAALRKLVWLAFPLGIVGVLDSLNANVPRYFIQYASGETALGYFSAMSYLMVAGSVVVEALAQSARPRLAKYYIEDVGAFRRLVWKLVGMGAAIAVGGVCVAALLGRPLLTILYRAEYAEHVDTFVWLMVGAGFWYISSFLGSAITAARRFSVQAPLFACTTLGTAVAAYLLVAPYGISGAAWAFVIGMAIRMSGSLIVVRALLPGDSSEKGDAHRV